MRPIGSELVWEALFFKTNLLVTLDLQRSCRDSSQSYRGPLTGQAVYL